MNVCIIGAGNVATHMAKALSGTAYNIIAIYSRTLSHAQALAQATHVTLATNDLMQLPVADVYLFALKDDVLHHVAQMLTHNPQATQGLWVHTAGTLPLDVLPHNRLTAVLYPLMTFSKEANINFHSLPLFIEGCNDEAYRQTELLARALSTHVTRMTSAQRKHLHLAAVFANNFTNHCCTLAYHLLSQQGIDPQCLQPIIDETAHKLRHMQPQQAQTGPARRWDVKVMNEQLQSLSNEPELQQIYQLMSNSIHQFAQQPTQDEATTE